MHTFKKISLILTTFAILLCSTNIPISAQNQQPDNTQDISETLHCKNAIVIDRNTKQVLYEKNSRRKIAPASMTKIMTAIVVIENTKNFDKPITIYNKDLNVKNINASITGLVPGEILTVEDALYCMLVTSGSEVAQALGRYTTGNLNDFIDLMNNKAKALHLKNTNFTNAFGADEINHYSTVEDMAKIMDYALTFPMFQKISRCEKYSFKTNKYSRILESSPFNYLNNLHLNTKHITGLKTGSIQDIGANIAYGSNKDGFEIVTVIANAPFDRAHYYNIEDAYNLSEWIYKNYKTKNIYTPSDTIQIKGSLLSPSIRQKVGTSVYLPYKNDDNIQFSKKITPVKHKLLIKPNDPIGIIEINNKSQTYTYKILSEKWHFSILVYIAILAYLFILIKLIRKKHTSK